MERTTMNGSADIRKYKKRSISSSRAIKNVEYDDSTELGEEAYDYDKFKREYEGEMGKDIGSNKTSNLTDEQKLEERPAEALRKLIDFQNCTQASRKSGIPSIDCLMYNYEQQKDKPIVKRTLTKIWITVKVWCLIYVCVAIPCWCHKGWCCCCFRCKFCFPKKRIGYAKLYYVNNPPGVFSTPVQKEEEPITYDPTEFEEDSYETLEAAIRNI